MKMAALFGSLFLLLFLFSSILLIIGLIKPALFSRWGAVRSRKKLFIVFFPSTIIFFIIFVSIAIYDSARVSNQDTSSIQQTKKTQTPKDAKQQLAELEKDLEKSRVIISAYIKDHPPVFIIGDIKDRERDSLLIWGIAHPNGCDPKSFGVLYDKSNIQVLNPDKDGFGSGYKGYHYFLRKASGKNAFGAQVPVWVYGDLPDYILKEDNKYKALSSQIEKLKPEIAK